MMVVIRRISLALGLLAAVAGTRATAQAVAPGPNQQTADAVASALRSSAALRGYRIDIESREGTVTLSGAVASPEQHREAMALAGNVSGVSAVVDRLQVSPDARVMPAQYQLAMGGHGLFHRNNAGLADGGIVDGEMAGTTAGGMAGATAVDTGPLPEGPAGNPTATAMAAIPNMPNFAWPSYAPYPNFSAVGYPTVYPWQAWPNIGPFYPYPEVPPDWRAVTLKYHDGLWYTKFKRHYTRPFIFLWPAGELTAY
jgi:hypothetical protein